MDWSDNQVKILAAEHFKGRSPRCPKCSGPLDVHEIEGAGKPSVDLMLNCRRCGANGKYSTSHLAAMELTWSPTQKVALVERYWAGRPLACPSDGARLEVVESREAGNPRVSFMVRCKHCGRYFWSNEVENKPDSNSFKGKYEPLREIGRGGMGYVSLVRDRRTGEQFAAKQILPDYLREPDVIRRFQREQRILEKLSHPRVVKLRDFFLDEDGAVIVMDFMQKGDLSLAIKNRLLPPEALANYFNDATEGLEYLHSQGVIHRDLKPTNILIGSDDRARISDFGLAALAVRDSTPLTQQGISLGTFLYAAPEQLTDAGNVSAAADVYALGLTAYEVATRSSPYRVVLSGLHPDLTSVLSIALEREPAQRKTSIREIASALRRHLTEPVTKDSV